MADTLDIRDLISRFEELESERENLQAVLQDALDEDHSGYEQSARRELAEWDVINSEEFTELSVLLTELSGRGCERKWRGDWYPVTLIPEEDFVDYVEELVSDIGDLPREIPSYIVIDWQRTADNVRYDYDEVDYQGNTYYFR